MTNTKFTPYSDNIVFFDTEFSSLNPYIGEILSVGLVKLGGEELYLELEYDGEYSDWVRENLLSTLTEPKVNREEAKKRIKIFLGEDKPYAVSYVNQFDAVYWYKMFGVENNPFFWLPIDFAAILFALSIDPEAYFKDDAQTFIRSLGIDVDKYTEHHALDDAKLLREVYLKLVTQTKDY